ncbi:MAG: DUF2974 domain-containing protein [Christensenellaceae bacterium]|nr:DUF2974 domain-containing protein [Christensenellaceae bacterium]
MKKHTNLFGYIKKTKNITFNEMPFNDVDSLAFATFSYILFDDIVGIDRPLILYEAVSKVDKNKIAKNDFFALTRYNLAVKMSKSKRYKDLLLNNYVNIIDETIETQFSAITIILEDFDYVAFRGTDETVIGWKEDFNMSFMSPIPAQNLAKDYINRRKTSKPFYVGGHSKGGNLSIYAASMCNRYLQDKIINIYSFDGPGFKKELLLSEGYNNIYNRIISYVPKSSIIGMMLNYHNKYHIVESKTIGILQHDTFSWKIDENKFVLTDKLTSSSEKTNEAMHTWFYSLTDSERENIVNIIFNIFIENNIKNFFEIKINLPNFLSLIESIKEIDEKSKENIMEIFRLMVDSGKEVITEAIKEKTVIGNLFN